MNPEERLCISEMIKEYREIEKHLEEQIIQIQTRLAEHRKRRGLLQDYLESEMEK